MSLCEYLSYEYLQYMQYLQISEMYTIPNPGLESSWNSFNTSDPAVCVLAYSGTTEAQSALVFLLNGVNSFRMVDWSVFYCLHWTWNAATPWHLHEKCLSFQWSCTVHKQIECDPPEHVSLTSVKYWYQVLNIKYLLCSECGATQTIKEQDSYC